MKSPHLTPENLIGKRFPKDTFGDIKVALVGFCPPPSMLSEYEVQDTSDQYFIHLSPYSVKICEYNGIRFLSLFHVYGGPVSSATVEELAYYGIETILAYGLAGGLGTKDLKLGDFYLVESAKTADGTTRHYTKKPVSSSDTKLNDLIARFAPFNFKGVRAHTNDTIYREYDEELQQAVNKDCDIINCDSSHLFAVSEEVGIAVTQIGVISDVVAGSRKWESSLASMLKEDAESPLELTGHIIKMYIKQLMPLLCSTKVGSTS